MSHPDPAPHGRILHLQCSGPLKAEVLAPGLLPCEPCFDPYRALARLGRSPNGEYLAAVVDLDLLTPRDFELFSQLRCLKNDLPVFIYESASSLSRIPEALARGATDVWSTESLERILQAVSAKPVDSPAEEFAQTANRELIAAARCEAQRFAEAISPAEMTSPPPVEDSTDADSITPDAEKPALADETPDAIAGEDDVSAAVRVPWLRYADAPVRVAPRRNPPAPPPAIPLRNTPREPLLTPEELHALIEEDWPETESDALTSTPPRPEGTA